MYIERMWLLITHTYFHGDTNKDQMHKNSNATVSMGWMFDQQKNSRNPPNMEQVFSQSWQTAPSTVWLWMFNAKIRVVALFSHCARTRRPNSESWTRIIILHTLRMMDLPPKVYVLIITVMDIQESVQFRMAFTHTGKPKINMLHPVSQRFPLHCLWNSSNVVWCLKYRDVCMYDWEHLD